MTERHSVPNPAVDLSPETALADKPVPRRKPDAVRRKAQCDKLAKRLRNQVGAAIADYGMIAAGDRVMVCLSGGKDSYAMLDLLLSLQRNAPVDFELVAVNLDQKQPGFPTDVLPDYLRALGVPFRIVEEDTYRIVKRLIPEGQTTCSLCSRLRRGVLYRVAGELGANRIALGHHRDDILETLLLNLFYGGTLKAMPPKLKSDDGRHIVIRPLAYCREKDIAHYAELKKFPIIPCTLCGSQPNLQREVIGRMLQDWDKQHPGRLESMFRALSHVVPSHLADRALFAFTTLSERTDAPAGTATPDGSAATQPTSDVATRAGAWMPIRFWPSTSRKTEASAYCRPPRPVNCQRANDRQSGG